MQAQELMAQIEAHEANLPKVRSVAQVYADFIAPLADRMSVQELQDAVALGALIRHRSTRLVPVLTLEQVARMDFGRPVL